MPKKPAPKASAKPAKAKAPAKDAAPIAAKPDETAAPAKAKAPIPPRPVPPHQQFLSKGGQGHKPQAMAKGRIFRHQGR